MEPATGRGGSDSEAGGGVKLSVPACEGIWLAATEGPISSVGELPDIHTWMCRSIGRLWVQIRCRAGTISERLCSECPFPKLRYLALRKQLLPFLNHAGITVSFTDSSVKFIDVDAQNTLLLSPRDNLTVRHPTHLKHNGEIRFIQETNIR